MLETVFLVDVVLSGRSIFLLARLDEAKIDRRQSRLIVTERDVPFRAMIILQLTTEIAFKCLIVSL